MTMIRKDDPKKGHVVLIYENDEKVFDSDGVFKKAGDLLFFRYVGLQNRFSANCGREIGTGSCSHHN